MHETAMQVIARLALEPLPNEGGFFRQTWVSPAQMANGRAAGSAIYFLLTSDGFSAFHQLRTDELWFFHAGDPVEHVQLTRGTREIKRTLLGGDLHNGHEPQLIVRGGVWQGAQVVPAKSEEETRCGWALVSCVMAPAWDEHEFTLGQRAELLREFPDAAGWIRLLTR